MKKANSADVETFDPGPLATEVPAQTALRRFRPVAWLIMSVLGLWMLGWEINVLWGPGPGRSVLFGGAAFVVALALLALLCVAGGALRASERGAWITIGAGCAVWVMGDLYYQAVLAQKSTIPIPSPADAGFLGFYPLAFAGVVLLFRARSGRTSPAQWLDGVTAALAVAALSASVSLDAVLTTVGGDPLDHAVNLAYPLGDLVVLAVIVGGLVVCGLRSVRTWMWAGAGFSMFCVADGLYLVGVADGSYHVGAWFDVGWPAAIACLAAGAWSGTSGHVRLPSRGAEGLRQILAPMAFAVVSIGLLLYTGSEQLNWAARILAAGSLAVVLLRLARTFRDYTEVMAEREHDATTDALTGLGNRRALNADLAAVAQRSTALESTAVAIFDLDGFKLYNDTFGHQAGDALLARMGTKLQAGLGGRGRAYRMGGDEFCVLIEDGVRRAGEAVERSVAALVEVGDGFIVRSSYGVAHIPTEAPDPEAALRLADQRMYDFKGSGRTSARCQSRDVLLAALYEHAPELGPHTQGLRELAEAVADSLGLDAAEVELVGNTALLHDVGKMAIPRAILNKPGALDADEWVFVRRHPAIGERIVSAAPALADVGTAVRATHERWDGTGYPDELAGSSIPLAARIVTVCDAFSAMIGGRPHATSRSTECALVELRLCASTQFDPAVVVAFEQVLTERAAIPALDAALPADAHPL